MSPPTFWIDAAFWLPMLNVVIARPRSARRALNRELDQIRAQRYASTVDELEEGLSGISVGIYSTDDALLGTVNISGLSQRFDQAARDRAVEHARETAHRIQAALRIERN